MPISVYVENQFLQVMTVIINLAGILLVGSSQVQQLKPFLKIRKPCFGMEFFLVGDLKLTTSNAEKMLDPHVRKCKPAYLIVHTNADLVSKYKKKEWMQFFEKMLAEHQYMKIIWSNEIVYGDIDMKNEEKSLEGHILDNLGISVISHIPLPKIYWEKEKVGDVLNEKGLEMFLTNLEFHFRGVNGVNGIKQAVNKARPSSGEGTLAVGLHPHANGDCEAKAEHKGDFFCYAPVCRLCTVS